MLRTSPAPWHAVAIVVAGGLLAACGNVPTDAGQASAPSERGVQSGDLGDPGVITLNYVKTETGASTNQWEGFVSGDVNGDLETEVVAAWRAGSAGFGGGPILHIQTTWSVSATPFTHSFEAELDGTLNTSTGKLLLNGTIVDGYLIGARVHNEGQLTGFVGARTVFEGTLTIITGPNDD